jgi:hypothetical protein
MHATSVKFDRREAVAGSLPDKNDSTTIQQFRNRKPQTKGGKINLQMGKPQSLLQMGPGNALGRVAPDSSNATLGRPVTVAPTLVAFICKC